MSHNLEIAIDEQVELCRKGNAQAYFEVYRRYAKSMFNSSMRIVNNLADAEDMVQEAFTDAFGSLERFTYKSSFEAWLKRIVINKSVSLLRKKKIIWADVDTQLLGEREDEYFDEEHFSCEVASIKTAIEQLPDTQRLVFNLFIIDQVPQEEIKKLLGLSHSNIRILYHRAKKKIIEILQQKVSYE